MAKKPKANPVGRPTEYKPEYCQMLIDHGRKGYSFEAFGGVVCVSKQTLYSWCKSFPEFLDAKGRSKSNSRLCLETMMFQIAEGKVKFGNAAPIIYMMKSIHNVHEDTNNSDDDEEIDGIEFVGE